MLRLIKSILDYWTASGNNIRNRMLFRVKKVKYRSFPKINGRIDIFKNGKITIGKMVKINSGSQFNPIGGDTRTSFSVAKGAHLKIGNHSGISNSTIVCRMKVEIGDYVNIGGGCKIYDTDFHALDPDMRMNPKTDIGRMAPVRIANNAFIGAHSIILKGVEIGESSIVGSGSVVSKSIPAGEIWAGNPAKFVKRVPFQTDEKQPEN